MEFKPATNFGTQSANVNFKCENVFEEAVLIGKFSGLSIENIALKKK